MYFRNHVPKVYCVIRLVLLGLVVLCYCAHTVLISIFSKSSPFPLLVTLVIQTTHKSIFIGFAFCLEQSRFPLLPKLMWFPVMEDIVIRHNVVPIRDPECHPCNKQYLSCCELFKKGI